MNPGNVDCIWSTEMQCPGFVTGVTLILLLAAFRHQACLVIPPNSHVVHLDGRASSIFFGSIPNAAKARMIRNGLCPSR